MSQRAFNAALIAQHVLMVSAIGPPVMESGPQETGEKPGAALKS